MIAIENLTKIYKGSDYEVVALDNVSLTIDSGEFVAIMGESGSGKSTLLNCIGLMDSFDKGLYRLKDIEIHNLKFKEYEKIRKDYISFIFQHFELMRNFTAYENIEIPLLAKNMKKKERRSKIHECAKKLGIDNLMGKYPYQLSGGQQQRVAVARAIVSDNYIILADEPTGALDSQNTMELIHLLKKLNEMGRTIVMVTHDYDVAQHSDRIIYLKDGTIVEN